MIRLNALDAAKKHLIKRCICLAGFLVLLCVSLVAYFMYAFAWFSMNKEVSANGMHIKSVGNVDFGDEVIVDRYFTNAAYTSNTPSESLVYRLYTADYNYYLYSEGSFVLSDPTDENSRIPFSLNYLLPGERINISFSISRPESATTLGDGYRLSFSGLDSDTFTINSETYSVLGICHMSVRTGQNEFSDKGFIVDYNGTLPDGYDTYSTEVFDEIQNTNVNVTRSTVPDFVLLEGEWDGEQTEPSLNVTVQLWFDLSNYNNFGAGASNLLSEKSIRIKELILESVKTASEEMRNTEQSDE